MLTAAEVDAKLVEHMLFGAMSEEQLKAFMEAVKADEALEEEVNGAGDDADAVVAIAKAAGFVISAEELAIAQAEVLGDELGGVIGGVTPAIFYIP